ncbi:MAG: TrmH family RNA methyltransferase [Gaiellales bacterium]
MAEEPIRSRANARLKAARKLQAKKHRLTAGLFLAEGEDIVEEGLGAGLLPVETFVAADRPPDESLLARLTRGGPVHVVADPLLAEIGTLGHPARVVGVFRVDGLPGRSPDADLGVFLDRVIDPGNVGTLVRAAGALGPAFVALSPGCSDPLSGKGVRASMGAVFRVPIETGAELPEVGTRIALVPGAAPLWELDLTGPVTFVVGAERRGLSGELVGRCDAVGGIPQAPEAESLNAAQAATLALYEAVRQRAARQPGSDPGSSP